MPRRRLSQRQIERIQTIQERRRQRLEERATNALQEMDEAEPRAGLVVVRHGANLAVLDDGGKVSHCLTRQHIGHPVCGDRVVWQPTGPEHGVVTAIQPRTTVLSRPDYGGRDKPLAANLTQLVVLLAPLPEPSEYLVDQYLVAAELMGISAMIVINKEDMLDTKARDLLAERFNHYKPLGYPVIWTSLKRPDALDAILPCFANQTSILVGQSGVGKSSLVKTLLPDRDIQIGRLSKATGLGRHTTSATTCYRIGGKGYLIDSPGVRSFRLGNIELDALERGFRDLAPFPGQCRFSDCHHDREPGCAVKDALQRGLVHPLRLKNFLHMAARLHR